MKPSYFSHSEFQRVDKTTVFYFQATFKGWMDIMYAAVDSRDVSVRLSKIIYWLYSDIFNLVQS